MDALITLATGISALHGTASAAHAIRNFFKNEQVELLILGCSGVGKSRLMSLFTKEEPDGKDTKTLKAQKVKVGKSYVQVWDTPGQFDREDKRRPAYLAVLEKRLLIINVVSYGYHQPLSDAFSTVSFESDRKLQEYLAKNRQTEIDYAAELNRELLSARKTQPQLITLVNKADLWWKPGESQIMSHYESKDGAYRRNLSAANFHHTLRCCLHSEPFFTTTPMTGFYGDDERIGDLKMFLGSLLECLQEL